MEKEKLIYNPNFEKYFEINYNLLLKLYNEDDRMKEHRERNGNNQTDISNTLGVMAMQSWLLHQWANGMKEFRLDFENNSAKNADKYDEVSAMTLFEINKILEIENSTPEDFDKLSKHFQTWGFIDVPTYLFSSYITKLNLHYLNQLTSVYKDNNKTYNELLKHIKGKEELLKEKKINSSRLEETLEKISQLEKQIIRPSNYDINSLAEYYINCFLKKRGKPSLRDLEKGSNYNKDKWGKSIFSNPEFLLLVTHKLKKIVQLNPELEISANDVSNDFLKRYTKIQETERKKFYSSKGVKNFNENIFKDYMEQTAFRQKVINKAQYQVKWLFWNRHPSYIKEEMKSKSNLLISVIGIIIAENLKFLISTYGLRIVIISIFVVIAMWIMIVKIRS